MSTWKRISINYGWDTDENVWKIGQNSPQTDSCWKNSVGDYCQAQTLYDIKGMSYKKNILNAFDLCLFLKLQNG